MSLASWWRHLGYCWNRRSGKFRTFGLRPLGRRWFWFGDRRQRDRRAADDTRDGREAVSLDEKEEYLRRRGFVATSQCRWCYEHIDDCDERCVGHEYRALRAALDEACDTIRRIVNETDSLSVETLIVEVPRLRAVAEAARELEVGAAPIIGTNYRSVVLTDDVDALRRALDALLSSSATPKPDRDGPKDGG